VSGFICAWVQAEEATGKYTLDECIRIGLEKSATAANARRDQAIASARVVQARAQALPHLTLSASYIRRDEVDEFDFEDSVFQVGQIDNYKAEAEVSQLLYSGGKMRSAVRAAKVSKDYADWTRAATEARIVRDTKTGFYDILLAEAAIRVREESVAQLRSQKEQTQRKFKKGTASEFDILSARVRLANERPELIKTENTYLIAIERFRRLLNLSDEEFKLEGELRYQPVQSRLDALYREARENRPEIRQMTETVRLRREDVNAARGAYLPTARATFVYGGPNVMGFMASGDEWEWGWYAGVAVQWSVWDGGLSAGTVLAKSLALEKTRAELEDLKKAVRLDVKRAYLDMQYAAETIESTAGSIALATKALGIASTRYKSGMSTYIEFTDANLALSTAKLTHSQALRDHMNAVAMLEYAIGVR